MIASASRRSGTWAMSFLNGARAIKSRCAVAQSQVEATFFRSRLILRM
jgi:hypothetical protein